MLLTLAQTAFVHKNGRLFCNGIAFKSGPFLYNIEIGGQGGTPGGMNSPRAFIFQTPDSKIMLPGSMVDAIFQKPGSKIWFLGGVVEAMLLPFVCVCV